MIPVDAPQANHACHCVWICFEVSCHSKVQNQNGPLWRYQGDQASWALCSFYGRTIKPITSKFLQLWSLVQVESAGVVLMDSITQAFEPLTKTDGSEPEKLRPKLRYNEKNMAVYIVVVKNSQVGHL